MSMSMVRSFLSPFLLLHLILLDLVEPAEDLVFKLLIHGVNKAGLVQLKLQGFLEELCLGWILLEDRRHQLQHVGFQAQHLQHLHHKLAKSLSPVPLFYLDLVTVNNLVIIVHVIAKMGERNSLALLSPCEQVPGVVRPHFLPFVFFLPAELSLHIRVISIGSIIEWLHIGLHQIKCPHLGLFRQLRCPNCLKFQIESIFVEHREGLWEKG